jgi:O-antigen ligase
MNIPHQEYLSILTEQGIIGLLIFCGLAIALARYIGRLDPPWRHFYFSLLLIYLVSGLVNNLWADFTHRHLFALWLACIPWAPGAGPAPAASAQERHEVS